MSAPPIISASGICLDLAASSLPAAVEETARLLVKDDCVRDWAAFWPSVQERQMTEPGRCGVCLAHGRSEKVRYLSLAAGRLRQPVRGDHGDMRLVFVFALPSVMSEEYLRAVGALARTCGDEAKLERLMGAATAEELAGLLERWVG